MASIKKSSNHDYTSFLTSSALSKAQLRWRTAYLMIRSVRVMLSLVMKEIVPVRRNFEDALHSVPYTSLNIEEPKTLPVITNVDAPHDDPEQTMLTEIVKSKDLEKLACLGGVKGVATLIRTSMENGISPDEVQSRKETYGSNTYQKPPPKGLLFFTLDAFKDTTILILLVCAGLALGFGIKEHGPQEGWYEGGSIFVAVFIVIAVSALSNSIFDIVVGDIVFLRIGDQIPADGLFLDGHSLQVDESSMTGESDHLEIDSSHNPFLLSGSKVVDGYGRKVVTSVGMNTEWGKMMSLSVSSNSNERTPLQERLDTLTSSIGKVGLSVAFVVLLVMLVRYFTGNTKDETGIKEYGSSTSTGDVLNAVVQIVAAAVTIVVVAIPEGLPLAVTLTLAFSMKRMMADQAMVRKLSACETMGSATVICTDKTGTLTLNQMKVTKFWIGQECIEEDSSYKAITSALLELFHQGVGLNTTGSIYVAASGSIPEFSGSPTEKAILSWAVGELKMDIDELKQSYTILHVETFNSEKKRSGVLIQKKADLTIHVHWKGAAEMILAMCSHYYNSNGKVKLIDEDGRRDLEKVIQGMAASSLRCIAFAHKKITEQETTSENNVKAHLEQENGFTLLGIVGLKDPCRPGAKTAVEMCKSAGVSIKMITGDNIFTAKAIAAECGILEVNDESETEEVIEGVEFRNLSEDERMERVEKIRVMARSSPFDKLLMVQCLKKKGHVVAVTGDGTNDAPALKEADIGLSMGIQGTEVAKESSDIVILDDNFNSVATVLRWGRGVYNNIQKFIQFQLTVNVAALFINFIAAVSAGEVPLTAVQLLWVNLIMDSLGALALATDRPTKELMQKPPVGRTEPLITNIMWRNLLAQAIYQILILLILQFQGENIFNVTPEVNDTLIFNTFVLCQVFNEFNARKLEERNVFKDIHKNHLFIGIIGITIVLQVVMVEFLKKFASTEKLNWVQWVICVAIAAGSWPIGYFVKFMPVPGKPIFSYLREETSACKRVIRSTFFKQGTA